MSNNNEIDIRTICLLLKAAYAQYCRGDYRQALESYQEIINAGHRYADAFWGTGVKIISRKCWVLKKKTASG